MAIVADMRVIEPSSALVSTSFPFTRNFSVWNRASGWPAVLQMAVKTGYTSGTKSASVRINGTEVGKISPHPWSGGLTLETMSIVFDASAMDNLSNVLTVVPASSDSDAYVIVGSVVLQYSDSISA